MVDHPNIKDAGVEWVIESGEWRTELVIVTDLETRPNAPGFDETDFNAMVEAACQAFGDGNYVRVRIKPESSQLS